jgi:cytochrome c553
VEKLLKILLFGMSFLVFVTFSNQALSGDVPAGEARYAQNCGNCHGPAGMGIASYPKLSGKEVSYLVDRLKTYRSGKKIGPNSGLMIMMAKGLSDEEIVNLAAYLSGVQQ